MIFAKLCGTALNATGEGVQIILRSNERTETEGATSISPGLFSKRESGDQWVKAGIAFKLNV
jgi:hypothetical protein